MYFDKEWAGRGSQPGFSVPSRPGRILSHKSQRRGSGSTGHNGFHRHTGLTHLPRTQHGVSRRWTQRPVLCRHRVSSAAHDTLSCVALGKRAVC